MLSERHTVSKFQTIQWRKMSRLMMIDETFYRKSTVLIERNVMSEIQKIDEETIVLITKKFAGVRIDE